jgi:hypothetical protein
MNFVLIVFIPPFLKEVSRFGGTEDFEFKIPPPTGTPFRKGRINAS